MEIGLLFPGQGSQFQGMGKGFYTNFSLIKELFEEASDAIKVDFKKLMFTENEDLHRTSYTQPAILLFSYGVYRILQQELGIEWKYGIGHSLGEFTALTGGGGLDLADGIQLVHRRGELMEESFKSQPGSMMVVLGLSDSQIEEICAEAQKKGLKIYPANYNSSGQVVVAGYRKDLLESESRFKRAGAKRVMVLKMSVASHCPLLQPAVEPLRQLVEKYLKPEFKPVISNVTAKAYSTKREGIELLPVQLIKPVKYRESVQKVASQVELFIELGGKVLTGLNRRITKVPTIPILEPTDLKKVAERIK